MARILARGRVFLVIIDILMQKWSVMEAANNRACAAAGYGFAGGPVTFASAMLSWNDWLGAGREVPPMRLEPESSKPHASSDAPNADASEHDPRSGPGSARGTAPKPSSSAGMIVRAEGNVKWFDPRKGYGFIVGPEGQDIFTHYSVIEGDGFRVLRDGSRVLYDAELSGQRWKATRVSRIESEIESPAESVRDPAFSRSPRR